MKARSGLLTLGLLLALAQGAAPAAAQSAPGYRIGIDDVLSIYVWDNKNTDQTVFVRPDGKISLPLAGEVEVRGMTVAELETRLTELYQRTIKAARVTVIVKEIRSRPIFFIGGVGRTGPMQLTQDWTLLQAVSAAGGLLPQADLEAAYILRTFAHYVRDGLIPNMFPDGAREGLYHTADASLWFFHAVAKYVEATGDRDTLRSLVPTLVEIARRHLAGTRFGIGVDPADGLLRQGAEGYQLTWMDAKVDGWVVTPRRGKAVEIKTTCTQPAAFGIDEAKALLR